MRLRLVSLALTAALIAVSASVATAADTSASIVGTVLSGTGVPIGDANIALVGPTRTSTTSDASGKFTFANVAAGIYIIDVTKGGYEPAEDDDITVLASQTVPVQIVLQQASLSTLKTIARVTTSASSSINTGSAAQSITGRQSFLNLASPQINDIVERIPGADIEKGSSSPNVTFTLAGTQGYETQVLIDGHPISIGRYGAWFSQFFNSFMVGGIETQLGPGNTTPFAGTAVGGTMNVETPAYTHNSAFNFVTGADSLGGSYTDALYSGSFGKLSYVLGAGTAGDNTLYTGTFGCVVDPNAGGNSGYSHWNEPGSTGIISFCGDLGGGQRNQGEIVKAKWDFSPSTSFEMGFLGSQAGYDPQGSAYGIIGQNMTIVNCINDTNSHNVAYQECGNPANNAFVGQTMNGFFFYPGSSVSNNMPLFTAQLRTAIGNNTLLVRPYGGSITRIIDGSGESDYGIFWYPAGDAAAASACSGSPNYGTPISGSGGMDECEDGPYTTVETDKLKGATMSFIHPMGMDDISLNYDYHSDETYAIAGDPAETGGLAPAIPDTMEKYNSISLTGDFALSDKLTLKAGGYQNWWFVNGIQAGPLNSSNKPTQIPLERTVGAFDPHLAFTFAPAAGTSMRLAVGSSTTFPYAAEVSGIPHISRATGTGGSNNTLDETSPTLSPEKAYEADLGIDKRLKGGTIVSFDLLDMQVHNVFEYLTYANTDSSITAYNQISEPVNAANISSQLAMLTIRHLPVVGFGYDLTATADRAVPTGIPLASTSYQIPANDVQQCSDGGSATCIPYLKGYGALEYVFPDRTFLHLGVDYEGKNNTYFQPPFEIFDATIRRPINDKLAIQASVYNLFNSNTFGGLVMPNQGTHIIGENGCIPGSSPSAQPNCYPPNGTGSTELPQYSNYTQSVIYPLLPVEPRTIRLQLEYGVGR